MPLIYKKTEKGLAEIETRAQRLTPRLRSLLILVDGRRSVDDIRAMVQQPTAEALQTLAMQGLVEVASEAATVAALSRAAAAAVTPSASTTPGLFPSAAPQALSRPMPLPSSPAQQVPVTVPAATFNALRGQAVRALLDAVGPAGDSLAMRMEKTRNLPELQPLLVQSARLVAEIGGSAAAEKFAARVQLGL